MGSSTGLLEPWSGVRSENSTVCERRKILPERLSASPSPGRCVAAERFQKLHSVIENGECIQGEGSSEDLPGSESRRDLLLQKRQHWECRYKISHLRYTTTVVNAFQR